MNNFDKIRNMSDDELEAYMRKLLKKKYTNCSICGEESTKTVFIKNEITFQTKKLCRVCDKHYEGLLDFLNTVPVKWDE